MEDLSLQRINEIRNANTNGAMVEDTAEFDRLCDMAERCIKAEELLSDIAHSADCVCYQCAPNSPRHKNKY